MDIVNISAEIETKIAAEQVADFLNSIGLTCHVRQWHKGEHGWFVVSAVTYERFWPVTRKITPSVPEFDFI